MENQMRFCKRCGKELPAYAHFCPDCGLTLHDDGGKDRSHKPWLIAAIVGAAIALAAVAGYVIYDNNVRQRALAQEKARQDSIATVLAAEQARQDSLATIERARQDSILRAQREEARLRENPVYLSCWGNIGSSRCADFVVNGITGYYKLEGESRKRTLKLKSHDKKSGHCVMDAYLGERYIGYFDGEYYNDVVNDYGEQHYLSGYRGTFHSVKGAKLEFYVYAD